MLQKKHYRNKTLIYHNKTLSYQNLKPGRFQLHNYNNLHQSKRQDRGFTSAES